MMGHEPQRDGDDEVIREFPRGERDALRVTRSHFKGRDYIHIRIYTRGDRGDMLPTRKGIALRVDELHDVSVALTAALDAISREGRR